MTAKEFFIEEFGQQFHIGKLESDQTVLSIAMSDIYDVMEKYAEYKTWENEDTLNI